MVMVAHLLVPALDADAPTTFSKKIITFLLREGMAFDGLIVSDALDMGALAGSYPAGEIAVRAVEAGIDILLHPADVRTTVDAVVAAVEQGRLTHQRILESVERIRDANAALGLFDRNRPASPRFDLDKHRDVARELGRNAVRVASGRKELLPVPRTAGVAGFIFDDDNSDAGNTFIHAMRDRFRNFSMLVVTPGTELPETLAIDCIRGADYVVIAFFSRISASKGRSGIDPRLREMALKLLRAAREAKGATILISFDSPYLLDQFRDAQLRIAAYDRLEDIQRAVCELLAGK
jgi:beta-glucosidase-like glycosyl hydrolase